MSARKSFTAEEASSDRRGDRDRVGVGALSPDYYTRLEGMEEEAKREHGDG